MNDTAAIIKSALTMRQVAEGYGFTPNRAGFIHCPLHVGDNEGSMKIYPEHRGFCCFGCGAKGSVIDFVMRLFHIPFKDAIEKLNNDFNLGMSLDKPTRAEMSRLMEQRQREARQREESKRREMEVWDRRCRIGAEIARCETVLTDNPPIRDGWNVTFPSGWSGTASTLERLRLIAENVDVAIMRVEKR